MERKIFDASSCGKLPTTNSSCSRSLQTTSLRSLRNLLLLHSLCILRSRSLCSLVLRNLCSLCSRSLGSRLRVARLRRAEMFRCFPCRRRRMSPG